MGALLNVLKDVREDMRVVTLLAVAVTLGKYASQMRGTGFPILWEFEVDAT